MQFRHLLGSKTFAVPTGIPKRMLRPAFHGVDPEFAEERHSFLKFPSKIQRILTLSHDRNLSLHKKYQQASMQSCCFLPSASEFYA